MEGGGGEVSGKEAKKEFRKEAWMVVERRWERRKGRKWVSALEMR